MLYREGTVNSQRACYFHEPFNVASKDIYIIHHSEMSQKTHLQRACLKTLFVSCFFSPLSNSEAKNSNKSFFFFFWGLFEEGFGDLNLLMGHPYQQCTRSLLNLRESGGFFLPASLFLCLPFLLISLTFFLFLQSANPVNSCRPQTASSPMPPSLKLGRAVEQDKEATGRSGGEEVLGEEGINVRVSHRLLLKRQLCSWLKSNS